MVLIFYKSVEYMSKKYESKVLEICDNGDAIIELPEEMLNDLGWKVGDVIEIVELQGRIILINKTKEV
jgi:bifunctional DNA-binding transcriptional regulator/antitoxin component of YhaV-PrlF toxin-antitoxin module